MVKAHSLTSMVTCNVDIDVEDEAWLKLHDTLTLQGDNEVFQTKDDKNCFCCDCGSCEYYFCDEQGVQICSRCRVIIKTGKILHSYTEDIKNENVRGSSSVYNSNIGSSMSNLLPNRRFDTEQFLQCRRMIKRQSWNNALNHRQKMLYKAYKELETIGEINELSFIIIQHAQHLYERLLEMKALPRGKERKGVLAAAIYIACKINGFPRSIKEIVEIFQDHIFFEDDEEDDNTGKKKQETDKIKRSNAISIVSKAIKRYQDALELDLNGSVATDYVHRLGNKFGLCKDERDFSHRLCKKVQIFVLDHTPITIASACIWITKNSNQEDVFTEDMQKFSETCGTTPVSLNSCIKKIRQYYIIIDDARIPMSETGPNTR